MTELQYNLNDKSYQVILLDTYVQGSVEANVIKISFGTIVNGNFVINTSFTNNADVTVGAVYTRPDGQHTFFMPFSKNTDGSFTGVITGWILRQNGILSIDVQVKYQSTGQVIAFNRFTTTIEVGTPTGEDDFVFTEADYQNLLNLLSQAGNKTYVGSDQPNSQEYGYWFKTPTPETQDSPTPLIVNSNPLGEETQSDILTDNEVVSVPTGEVNSPPIENGE